MRFATLCSSLFFLRTHFHFDYAPYVDTDIYTNTKLATRTCIHVCHTNHLLRARDGLAVCARLAHARENPGSANRIKEPTSQTFTFIFASLSVSLRLSHPLTLLLFLPQFSFSQSNFNSDFNFSSIFCFAPLLFSLSLFFPPFPRLLRSVERIVHTTSEISAKYIAGLILYTYISVCQSLSANYPYHFLLCKFTSA